MTGVVKSTKMTKALVVEVESYQKHPKYHKTHKSVKKYSVACSDSNDFKVGQKVEIESCRPVSKTIKFKVVEA